MKMRVIAPVAMAAIAAAIGFAPIATAAPTATTTDTGGATVVQSPGNAQVTAQPGASALQAGELQQPFFGYGYGGACCSTTAVIAEPLFDKGAPRAGRMRLPRAGRTFSCGGAVAAERR